MCFLLTGQSDIRPVSSFGYFAACVVFLDYLFTNLVYPSVFSVYYTYLWSRRSWAPCGCCLIAPYAPEETDPRV